MKKYTEYSIKCYSCGHTALGEDCYSPIFCSKCGDPICPTCGGKIYHSRSAKGPLIVDKPNKLDGTFYCISCNWGWNGDNTVTKKDRDACIADNSYK